MRVMFSHIGLNCNDPGVTERFYSHHFGFQKVRDLYVGGSRIIFLRAGDILLELFRTDSGIRVSGEGTGPDDTGFRHMAFQVDDIKEKLSVMGDEAVVTYGPVSLDEKIKGWKVVWIRDPDGRIIELGQGYRDGD